MTGVVTDFEVVEKVEVRDGDDYDKGKDDEEECLNHAGRLLWVDADGILGNQRGATEGRQIAR